MSKVTPNQHLIIQEYRTHDSDTGSCFVQVALLTKRIEEISLHLKTHANDFSARRILLQLVAKRRKFLEYIRKNFTPKYEDLMNKLGLKIKNKK